MWAPSFLAIRYLNQVPTEVALLSSSDSEKPENAFDIFPGINIETKNYQH